jgi:hypothetical protein
MYRLTQELAYSKSQLVADESLREVILAAILHGSLTSGDLAEIANAAEAEEVRRARDRTERIEFIPLPPGSMDDFVEFRESYSRFLLDIMASVGAKPATVGTTESYLNRVGSEFPTPPPSADPDDPQPIIIPSPNGI